MPFVDVLFGHVITAVGRATGFAVAKVLSVVVSTLGYPAESLNHDMDMESDLGIDSIKRVEILSALDERMFVNFFSRTMLTLRSTSREYSPITMPSYTSVAGLM